MNVRSASRTRRVWIVVLGDIGCSPRMQNHCQSFAEKGNLVEVIGFVDSKPNQEILSDPRININKMTPFPDLQFPRIIKYIFKIFWSVLSLLSIFFSVKKADVLMLQNPPGIPTLALCYLYCKVVKAKFIIDWHNYTWTIMALESSNESKVVKFAKFIESYFGRKSDLNFCVTEAMKQDLVDNWNIEATVLYDRPPEKFQPLLSADKKHELFQRLATLYPEFRSNDSDSTAFTITGSNGDVKLREDRPGLLVSSTSWTPDEDFQILLDALVNYEKKAAEDEVKYPKIVCVITGKGPQKALYKEKIAEMSWKYVKIVTPWLENEDYPLILGCADLGVCLHYSSSGLDLPMKVVDMFGCGLPVCAMNFKW
jgi:beta-1,4-mannosyltransferase